MRRLVIALLTSLVLAPGTPVHAQSATAGQPVRIVVQYQVGGFNDVVARVVGEALSVRLGRPVVVENRAGGNGIVATDHVAKSLPDGNTLLFSTPEPITSNAALYKNLPYDPRMDLRMVSDIGITQLVFVVNAAVPATDARTLLDAIKASPGRYAMGSWGSGSLAHLVQAYMDQRFGLKTVHVPYRGVGPLMADLLGNTLQMTLVPSAAVVGHVREGRVRVIAAIGDRRIAEFPDAPTFAEQGYADPVFSVTGPSSILVPANTPDPVVRRLSEELMAVVQQPAVRQRIVAAGGVPVGNAMGEAAAVYQRNFDILTGLIRSTGVTAD